MGRRTEGGYEVIGHRRGQPCPMCQKATFCDDCGGCEACSFTAPQVVELPYPLWPEPMPLCEECNGTPLHERTCSVTRRAAAN